jgi:uncharacterized protein
MIDDSSMTHPTYAVPTPGPKPKFLIGGASGSIGTALVRSWAQDRIHVVRLVRSGTGKTSPNGKADLVFWDPAADPAIADQGSLNGVTAVVHLSGANIAAGRWTRKYKQEIAASRIQSTAALARTLSQLNPLPRVLVCASAFGIYGDRGDEILDEESAPGSRFLAETCVIWEAATRIAQDAGIRVVHARFGVVLSPEGGALARMLPIFRLGLGGNLGDGRAWMPWLTMRDAVGILRFCIDNEGVEGPVNVVGPNPVTNAEFTRALGAAVHRPAFLMVPAFALRLAFGEMADQALLASARVMPEKLVKAGYQFADPEIATALKSLVR